MNNNGVSGLSREGAAGSRNESLLVTIADPAESSGNSTVAFDSSVSAAATQSQTQSMLQFLQQQQQQQQQQQIQQQQLLQFQQLQNFVQQQGGSTGFTASHVAPVAASFSNSPQQQHPNPVLILQLLQQQQQQQPQPENQVISMILAQILQCGLHGNQQGGGSTNALLQQLFSQGQLQQQNQQQQIQPQQHQPIVQTAKPLDVVQRGGSQNKRGKKRPSPSPALLQTSSRFGSGSSNASHQTQAPTVTASSSDNSHDRHLHLDHYRSRPEGSSSQEGGTTSDDSNDHQKRMESRPTSSDQGSSSSQGANSSDKSSDTAENHGTGLPLPQQKMVIPNKDLERNVSNLDARGIKHEEEDEDEDEAYDDSYDDDGGDEEEEDDSDDVRGTTGRDRSKEKAKDGSNTFKVPCRARGMAMDHNPLTAFFLIPTTIRHGQDVICSHPSCNQAGVKFRWCSSCETPVAKRNFGRRHSHAGNEKPPKKNHDKTVAAKDKDDPRKRPRENISDGGSDGPQLDQKKARVQGHDIHRYIPESIGNRRSDDSPSSAETDSTSGSGTDAQQQDEGTRHVAFQDFDPPRLKAWVGLLNHRPKFHDRRAMSVWVRKVLVVSDTTQPLSRLDDISVSTDDEEMKQNGEEKSESESSSGSE